MTRLRLWNWRIHMFITLKRYDQSSKNWWKLHPPIELEREWYIKKGG